MSSRAFRRLNREADVIRISENVEGAENEEEGPGFVSMACKKKGPVANPFYLVGHLYVRLSQSCTVALCVVCIHVVFTASLTSVKN